MNNTETIYITLALGVAILVVGISTVILNEENSSHDHSTHSHEKAQAATLPPDEYDELKKKYARIVKKKEAGDALRQFREDIQKDADISSVCHPLVHSIGHAAYEKYKNFGQAMWYQDDVCNNGYMHGVIELYFSQAEDITDAMFSVCESYADGSYNQWQCYHGLGHGFMFHTDNHLPDSVAYCDEYDNEFKRSACVNGVYMENFNALDKVHPSDYLNIRDPDYPCDGQPNEYRATCYLYAPTYYLNLHPGDYAGALTWCDEHNRQDEYSCSSGVGMQAMKENIDNVEYVLQACRQGKKDQIIACISGASSYPVFHFGNLSAALERCDKMGEFSDLCRGRVSSHRGWFE